MAKSYSFNSKWVVDNNLDDIDLEPRSREQPKPSMSPTKRSNQVRMQPRYTWTFADVVYGLDFVVKFTK